MIDNVNPTSQFHPYQPPDAIPQTGSKSGVRGWLRKVGIDQSKIDALSGGMRGTNMRGQLGSLRGYARNNSGKVLGGLAALVIGAGLLRRRSAQRF